MALHMDKKTLNSTLRIIADRSVPGGGFSEKPNTPFRADATAWAILALGACGAQPGLMTSARARLADEQMSDGRVCLAKEYPHAYWPTSIAIMAWNSNQAYAGNVSKAFNFLINNKGLTLRKSSNQPYAHDPSIPGWAWIDNTFSWIEPTTLSILALLKAGYGRHARVSEGIRLLMDRQLPRGGWNYGNTVVYGQELYAQPESTGMALTALAGQVDKKEIQRSLDYLKTQVVASRTPLSLGWSIFGLSAWGHRPSQAEKWIIDCLSRQSTFGNYGTTLLSLLVLAYTSNGGFPEMIA